MDGLQFDRRKLQEARKRRALTQRELAAAAGISYVTVCRLETGARKSPRPPTIRHLADALGIEPAALMSKARKVKNTTT